MTPPAACAAWLDELLGQLSDRPAHLVGFSYGGWIAMNQAMRAPARVASITLFDPAGLTRLDVRFWWWLSISGLATLTPMPLRRRLARWLDLPAMLHQELMTLMRAGTRGYRQNGSFPPFSPTTNSARSPCQSCWSPARTAPSSPRPRPTTVEA